jgi:hypothetical protein
MKARLNLIGTTMLPEVDEESSCRVGDDFRASLWEASRELRR